MPKQIRLIVLASVAALVLLVWGIPQINVYSRAQAGRAALMEAESTLTK